MPAKNKRWIKSAIKTAKSARLKPLSVSASRGPVARLRDAAAAKTSSAA